ncbi:MAG TPA: diguanylate cyclase [Syntrophales bacterium]|nr:diguanylate cyclase [Syntrophales bacterium]
MTEGRPIIQGMIYDITERKTWEEALKNSEEKYRTLVESSTDVILLLDGARIIQSCNHAFLNTFGFERREAEGQSTRIFHSSDKSFAAYAERVYRLVETRDIFRTEWNLARRDGTVFPAEISTSAVRGADGKISNYVIIIRDITDRKRQERKLTFMAMHDHLTGLPNRTLFMDRLHQAIGGAARKKHFVSVMYLDLDYFKNVNDSYGHGTGDELLKAVGARLRETLRKTDTVARMGGDEFMLLLSDLENKEDTLKIARKAIAAFRTPFDAGGRSLHITPSIGISVYPDDGDTFEVLAKNADIAMYHAKETGRNSYELYTPRLEYRY